MASKTKEVNAIKEEHNPFVSPWEESDVVFVVEEKELHVHRLILQMQSPVFKALFERHFKEASSQENITLEGKVFGDMLSFFKLLYPPSMVKSSLNEQTILKTLAIADEYQTTHLIKKMLQDVVITPSNALEILPVAMKYDATVGRKCTDMAEKSVRTAVLQNKLCYNPLINTSLTQQILLQKCRILENVAEHARSCLTSMMDKREWWNDNATYKSRCQLMCALGHRVPVFHTARQCAACLKLYDEKFCKSHQCQHGSLLKLMGSLDDVLQ